MLKRTITVALLVVLGHTLAFSLQGSGLWQKFNSPEGKFTILVPAKSEVEVKDVDSEVGKLTQYSYASSTSTGYFQITYADYPVEPASGSQDKVLDAVREGVMKSLEAELVSQKSISLSGHPGREFAARKAVQGIDTVFNWRVLLVGRRLYQLVVVTPRKENASADVKKFMTSFALNK